MNIIVRTEHSILQFTRDISEAVTPAVRKTAPSLRLYRMQRQIQNPYLSFFRTPSVNTLKERK